MRTVYSPEEVAEMEGCSIDHVYSRLLAGEIPGAVKVRSRWQIPAAYVLDKLGVSASDRAALLMGGAA